MSGVAGISGASRLRLRDNGDVAYCHIFRGPGYSVDYESTCENTFAWNDQHVENVTIGYVPIVTFG